MIKINYENLIFKPDMAGKYDNKLAEIKQSTIPSFEREITDLDYIVKAVGKYKKYKNVILIGNGGSRVSALVFHGALAEFRNNVKFEFLNSAEPCLINNLRKKYSKEDTLVLAISKGGDNINALEPLLMMADYHVLVITGGKDSVLLRIANARKWEIIIHPEVGGRFAGMTTCSLVPAYLMGLDVKKIYNGAKKGYKKYLAQKDIGDNNALKLALYFFELESKGYTEIFASIYSTPLFSFLPLLIQLIHEGTGKDGKGQTIFGDYSPESQHHTNQRFFGGRKNVAGLFMGEEKNRKDITIKIPKDLKTVYLNSHQLVALDGIKALETLHYDMEGVVRNCKNKKIPFVKMMINEITPENIGELMVFWQYFAVYSAILRDQNPYDQPEVEESKKISFQLRVQR